MALLTVAVCATQAFAQGTEPEAYVRLEYHAVVVRESVGEDVERKKPLVPRTESTFVVTLGPRVAAVEQNGKVRVWDYETGRQRRLDLEAGTYMEGSLLQHVAFVQMEMANRARLRDVLAAAGKADEAWAPFELSILFGWQADGDEIRFGGRADDDVALTRSAADGMISFANGDDVVSSWTPSTHTLDDAQQAAFSRFLQRDAHLHPDVRSALVTTGVAPAQLSFRWRNTGMLARATWTLAGAERVRTRPGDVSAMERSYGAGALGRLGRIVLGPETESTPNRLTSEEFIALSLAANEAGRYGDAMLLLIEGSLSTGAPMTEEIRELTSTPEQRAVIDPLMRAIGGPMSSLESLDAVDRSRLSRPAILDVFRANALRALGRHDEARDLMLATLETAPWITMAYKDLGDIHYSRFRTMHAWTAWDLGRAIAPEHGCWRQLSGYEKQLRETFADLL